MKVNKNMENKVSSESLMAEVFDILAATPTQEAMRIANEIWSNRSYWGFHPSKMNIDNSLIVLGLAARGVSPEFPEDGERVIYMNSQSVNPEIYEWYQLIDPDNLRMLSRGLYWYSEAIKDKVGPFVNPIDEVDAISRLVMRLIKLRGEPTR